MDKTAQVVEIAPRPPPSGSYYVPCPQDEEWGAGVSSIKPSGMPTRGVIVMSCFVKSRPECHTASPFHPVHNGFRSKVCATEEATSWVQLTSHYLCRRTLSDLFAHLVSCADPHTQTKPSLKVLTCIVLCISQRVILPTQEITTTQGKQTEGVV